MKMKSVKPGNRISQVEVTNVSQHGFWLYILDKEVFLSFENFPWFRDVAIGHLMDVQLPHTDHLYWPDLDVDLSVESLYHPERFPLVARGNARQNADDLNSSLAFSEPTHRSLKHGE